ncbi:MAG: hypothetical protein CMJ23_10975 [Phycisphaerae bacterium]|nr:hypothetical protein [Phycisphaerae bacterium]
MPACYWSTGRTDRRERITGPPGDLPNDVHLVLPQEDAEPTDQTGSSTGCGGRRAAVRYPRAKSRRPADLPGQRGRLRTG